MLTDTKLKNLKPKDKAYKETDAAGLFVEVRKTGAKIFRYGVGMGLCERDLIWDLPNDIFKKQEKENYPYLTKRVDLYQLFNTLDYYVSDFST